MDLASDLAYAVRVDHALVALDDHPEPSTMRSGLSGLRELATVNRAIGVLIGSGGSVSDARAALRQKADEGQVDLPVAAAAILHAAVPTVRSESDDG